jgi:hypothetical protein
MTEQTITAASLADDLRSMADKVDQAGTEAIADTETLAAVQHLMESLEAAERAAASLRDGP